MADVIEIKGKTSLPNHPNEPLIALLKDLLNFAETGQLQSFCGTGFTTEGLRITVLAPGSDVYSMQGAIHVLAAEHLRQTGGLDG